MAEVERDAHTASAIELQATDTPNPPHWLQFVHTAAPMELTKVPAAQVLQTVEPLVAL